MAHYIIEIADDHITLETGYIYKVDLSDRIKINGTVGVDVYSVSLGYKNFNTLVELNYLETLGLLVLDTSVFLRAFDYNPNYTVSHLSGQFSHRLSLVNDGITITDLCARLYMMDSDRPVFNQRDCLYIKQYGDEHKAYISKLRFLLHGVYKNTNPSIKSNGR